jgi:hypothetical protein
MKVAIVSEAAAAKRRNRAHMVPNGPTALKKKLSSSCSLLIISYSGICLGQFSCEVLESRRRGVFLITSVNSDPFLIEGARHLDVKIGELQFVYLGKDLFTQIVARS